MRPMLEKFHSYYLYARRDKIYLGFIIECKHPIVSSFVHSKRIQTSHASQTDNDNMPHYEVYASDGTFCGSHVKKRRNATGTKSCERRRGFCSRATNLCFPRERWLSIILSSRSRRRWKIFTNLEWWFNCSCHDFIISKHRTSIDGEVSKRLAEAKSNMHHGVSYSVF